MKKLLSILMIFSILFLMLPTTSLADEGDFYKKHKKEFQKANLSKEYIETMQKFDYDTNSFNCGMTELSCKMTAYTSDLGIGLAKFAGSATKFLLKKPETIVKDKGFVKFKNFMSTLSVSMLTLFAIWQIIAMMMRRFGDPDDYPQAMNQKMLSLFAGGVFLGLYETIFTLILQIQYDATNSILQAGVGAEQLVLMVLLYSPEYSIIFGIAMAAICIVFVIAIFYRFVALGFFYVVGPIAIPTIVNEEFNYFQIWLKYIVNNCVTLFVQSVAFSLAVAAMTGQFSYTKGFPDGLDVIMGFVLALCMCFFALVIPGILGNMGSSTGTGRMAGKVVRYALTRR